MGAVELMDDRTDSGAGRPLISVANFDPATPLTCDHLLAIFQRLERCEMTFHSGFPLAQTIYTCLFVHHIDAITMDALGQHTRASTTPSELTGLVLRAYLLGLLKSLELVCTEINAGPLYSSEDMVTQTFDVDLASTVSLDECLDELDAADAWLASCTTEPKERLYTLRLHLQHRQHQLILFQEFYRMPMDQAGVSGLISSMRMTRATLDASILPSPRAQLLTEPFFDPQYARYLPTHSTPKRTVGLLSQEQTGKAQMAMLNDLDRACGYRRAAYPLRCIWLERSMRDTDVEACAFARSMHHTAVVGEHADSRVTAQSFIQVWCGPQHCRILMDESALVASPLASLMRDLGELLVERVALHFQNRARKHRKLAKHATNWQVFQTKLLPSDLVLSREHVTLSLRALVTALDIERLYLETEVLWSGFECDVYQNDEIIGIYAVLSLLHDRQSDALRLLARQASPSNTPDRAQLAAQSDLYSLLCKSSIQIVAAGAQGYIDDSKLARRLKYVSDAQRLHVLASSAIAQSSSNDKLLERLQDVQLDDIDLMPGDLSLRARTRD
ncbi:hypothetical protein E5Q_00369 [Mixia osmundae IAM 14324]|nr:hypothetical protein E5Q_00369 [Mixia osmundae IAM 14324]